MAGSAQPGAAVDGGTVVVARPQVGLAGVQSHAHAQRRLGRPGLQDEGALERAGGRERVSGAGKNGEETVALAAGFDKETAVLGEELDSESIVASEGKT